MMLSVLWNLIIYSIYTHLHFLNLVFIGKSCYKKDCKGLCHLWSIQYPVLGARQQCAGKSCCECGRAYEVCGSCISAVGIVAVAARAKNLPCQRVWACLCHPSSHSSPCLCGREHPPLPSHWGWRESACFVCQLCFTVGCCPSQNYPFGIGWDSTGTCTSSYVLDIIAFRSPISSLIFSYFDVKLCLQRDWKESKTI